jgi:hypothetical protein
MRLFQRAPGHRRRRERSGAQARLERRSRANADKAQRLAIPDSLALAIKGAIRNYSAISQFYQSDNGARMSFPSSMARLALLALGALTPGGVLAEESAPAVATMGPAVGPDPNNSASIAGWLLYPTFMGGPIFNDNLYQTQINRRAALGLSLQPNLLADLDNGANKTRVHFNATAQLYKVPGAVEVLPSSSFGAPTAYASPTNTTGRIGVSHIWTPASDLIVNFIAYYERQNGLFATNLWGAQPNQTMLSATTVSSVPQYTNQITGQVQVEKQIGERWFLRGAVGSMNISYQGSPIASNTTGAVVGVGAYNAANAYGPGAGQNGYVRSASVRGGYWIIPQAFAFVEVGADNRVYKASFTNTNGQNLLCGVGVPRAGLFSGEIHFGYQTQVNSGGAYGGRYSNPAAGIHFSYYPTEYFTLSVAVSQMFSVAPNLSTASAVSSTGVTGASAALVALPGQPNNSRTLQAQFSADYSFSAYWKAHLRGGYGDTKWSNPASAQTLWSAMAGFSYNFWRNLDLTFEYQLNKSFTSRPILTYFSPGVPSGYTQTILTAGVSWTY